MRWLLLAKPRPYGLKNHHRLPGVATGPVPYPWPSVCHRAGSHAGRASKLARPFKPRSARPSAILLILGFRRRRAKRLRRPACAGWCGGCRVRFLFLVERAVAFDRLLPLCAAEN